MIITRLRHNKMIGKFLKIRIELTQNRLKRKEKKNKILISKRFVISELVIKQCKRTGLIVTNRSEIRTELT